MAYSNLILLLPLYYLLPLITGQSLEIDRNGIFYYSQDAELQRLPVCFISEPGLSECSPGQKPTVSLKTVKQDESSYRKVKTKTKYVQDIYVIWPELTYEPQRLSNRNPYIYPPPAMWPTFNQGYWTVKPIYAITPNGETIIMTDVTQMPSTLYYYKSAKGRNSKKEINLEVVPFNVSGCLPVNNTICEEGQINKYQQYLKELKSILGRSEEAKIEKGSSDHVVSEIEEDEESYAEEKEEELEIGEPVQNETENEIEDSSSSQIATQEFADKIGESVVRHLKKVTSARCPVTVRSLDVVVRQEENCKPKLESVDVELENNVTNKPESNARSRLHYKAGQKRFRINL